VAGEDRYVAVSAQGVIAWSADGDIWHKGVRKGRRHIIYKTFEGGDWVYKDCYETEADSDNPFPKGTYDSHNPFPQGTVFNAVAFGGGVFVAVGNNGRFALSTDGIEWDGTFPLDGQTITMGDSILSNPQGSNTISGFTGDIRGIAYGNGVFVAVGGSDSAASVAICAAPGYTSAAWSVKTPSGWSSRINDIDFKADTFYIVGDGGQTGWATSPDSSDWHHYAYNAGGTGLASDAGYPFFGNDILKVCVGEYGAGVPGIGVAFAEWGGRRTAVAKAEAFRWSDHSGDQDWDGDLDTHLFGSNDISGIAWGGGYYVAAGGSAITGWWPSAAPGASWDRYWRALCLYDFQWWRITAVEALNGRFFVGGDGGKIGYSR
ncbi:MAG: hypothetical protein LBR16_09475, partial [Treponema sp.]|nr:hypothetical protein [Treponema sp.]